MKEERLDYLAADIIKQAIIDLKSDDEENRKDVMKFFKSEWFKDICTVAEIEPSKVIAKLNKNEREFS